MSGQFNEFTSYQYNCAGDLHFKSDHSLESTCKEGFFPTGVKWQVNSSKLWLKDSYGADFVNFEIKKLDRQQLILVRKDVEYAFTRAK